MEPDKWMNGIASILWPILAILVLFKFAAPVESIISSARSREFSLEVGGQRLTMKEANDQNQRLIADLQKQVVDLKKLFDGIGSPSTKQKNQTIPTEPIKPVASLQAPAVLWVDDNPKNNSYFIQRLRDARVSVDLANSTREALEKLSRNRYSVIISDMSRDENGKLNPDAGLELLKQVRQISHDMPFVVFSYSATSNENGKKALALGANGVTSSATELFAFLGLAGVKS